MLGICENNHQTGNRICYCGARRVSFAPGQGKVNVSKINRPRYENGLNELDELRRQTRVGKTIPRMAQLKG